MLQWSAKKIARVDAFAGLTDRPAPSAGGSTTFLLVGSDAREGMSHADLKRLHLGSVASASGRRADTMLMMHISPQNGTVTVVSLPRDSYVTIPAHRAADGSTVRERRDKLNSAYSFGGAPLTVGTVERTTGVRIDHYLEVDFLGFERLVDAIGGVDVCAPTKLRDRLAGLRLPKGVSHVDGETALAYVRARHLDARADLGRIDRQQRFLGSMADRVTSRDVLLDPRALVRFLNAALDAVRADPGLTEKGLVTLGTELRHASGKDVRFRTVPIANPSYRVRGAGAVALWDAAAAKTLFTAMREDTSTRHLGKQKGDSALTIPPAQISVQVYNGSKTVGLATSASQELSGRGFDIAGPAQNWRTNASGTHDPALRRSLLGQHQDACRGRARRSAGGRARSRSHAAGRDRLAVHRDACRPRLGGERPRDQRRRNRGRPRGRRRPLQLVVADLDAEVVGEQRGEVQQLCRADHRTAQVVEAAERLQGRPAQVDPRQGGVADAQ